MPITDPAFQHEDEDWTQITQPRLRKRVQNRVSQRKHRNKVRQQRAGSIDAGQGSTGPVAAPGNNLSGHPSFHSNSSYNWESQRSQHEDGFSKQHQSIPGFYANWNGVDDVNTDDLDSADYTDSSSSWVSNPSSAYPTASTYPMNSASVARSRQSSDASPIESPHMIRNRQYDPITGQYVPLPVSNSSSSTTTSLPTSSIDTMTSGPSQGSLHSDWQSSSNYRALPVNTSAAMQPSYSYNSSRQPLSSAEYSSLYPTTSTRPILDSHYSVGMNYPLVATNTAPARNGAYPAERHRTASIDNYNSYEHGHGGSRMYSQPQSIRR